MIFPKVNKSKTVNEPKGPVWPRNGFGYGYLFHISLITVEETLRAWYSQIQWLYSHVFPLLNQNLNIYMTVE